jgi:hypothetical protein
MRNFSFTPTIDGANTPRRAPTVPSKLGRIRWDSYPDANVRTRVYEPRRPDDATTIDPLDGRGGGAKTKFRSVRADTLELRLCCVGAQNEDFDPG